MASRSYSKKKPDSVDSLTNQPYYKKKKSSKKKNRTYVSYNK